MCVCVCVFCSLRLVVASNRLSSIWRWSSRAMMMLLPAVQCDCNPHPIVIVYFCWFRHIHGATGWRRVCDLRTRFWTLYKFTNSLQPNHLHCTLHTVHHIHIHALQFINHEIVQFCISINPQNTHTHKTKSPRKNIFWSVSSASMFDVVVHNCRVFIFLLFWLVWLVVTHSCSHMQ